MASMKTTVCFSLAVLATAFVLSTSTTPSPAVNPFCDTADNKALCTQLAKGAETWPEAMTNALKAVLEKAKAGKPIANSVGSKLPANLYPQSKESIDSTCREAYDNIMDNIKQCIGFVKSDPYSSLNTYLSATSFSDCTDGLEEFGVTLAERPLGSGTEEAMMRLSPGCLVGSVLFILIVTRNSYLSDVNAISSQVSNSFGTDNRSRQFNYQFKRKATLLAIISLTKWKKQLEDKRKRKRKKKKKKKKRQKHLMKSRKFFHPNTADIAKVEKGVQISQACIHLLSFKVQRDRFNC
ncbi:hypothetical protein Pfo_024224 [Paulownia fortunei]|nr:hypothetical protein Pfo_024224 [Paulownia fortunei]